MFVSAQVFHPGQHSLQSLRVMDKQGEMLGANVVSLVLVIQIYQRYFLVGTFAKDTFRCSFLA